jgi:hypothetical protein
MERCVLLGGEPPQYGAELIRSDAAETSLSLKVLT